VLLLLVDKLGVADDKSRVALKSVKTRLNAALPSIKSAIASMASNLASNSVVDDLRKQLTTVHKDVEEKDKALLD
jgi:hypothetical protein